MAKSFRDLKVWQASMNIAVLVYRLTATFPSSEQYGLTSQMRRAAVSISSNIAEGSGRESRKDFRYFVLVARGSTCELQTQIALAARLGYLSEASTQDLLLQVDEVGRMLNGLATFLKATATGAKSSH